MTDDEKYLRDLDYPEDRWVLSGQQWYATGEAAEKLGVSDETLRKFAAGGAIPGAIQHDTRRVGWRLPRSGLIAYIAGQRRRTAERQHDAS
jgi:Helix-turn-helix domain